MNLKLVGLLAALTFSVSYFGALAMPAERPLSVNPTVDGVPQSWLYLNQMMNINVSGGAPGLYTITVTPSGCGDATAGFFQPARLGACTIEVADSSSQKVTYEVKVLPIPVHPTKPYECTVKGEGDRLLGEIKLVAGIGKSWGSVTIVPAGPNQKDPVVLSISTSDEVPEEVNFVMGEVPASQPFPSKLLYSGWAWANTTGTPALFGFVYPHPRVHVMCGIDLYPTAN